MWKLLAVAVALVSMLAGPTAAQPHSDYRLGAGDQIRLKVYVWQNAVGEVHEWSAMNAEYRVGSNGSLSIPLVGEVPAAGHTVDDVARAISSRLQAAVGIAKPPAASVEVVKYRPFYILGSVNHPGEYAYRPGMTVLQAVSIAGGLYRVTDPGLMMFQRSSVTTAGDLQALRAEYYSLLARRARLQAEADGSEKVPYPPELLKAQNDPAVAQLIQSEQAMFASRRDALRSQTDAFNHLKELLNGEISSLKSKMANVDQELSVVQGELSNTSTLVRKGLAVAPREFSLQETRIEVEGRRLDLDTAVLRAQSEIGRTDESIVQLHSQERKETLTELAQVQTKLPQVSARIKTAKLILDQEITTPELAALLGEGSGIPGYSLLRSTDQGVQEIAASETTIVQPGDTIQVKRTPVPLVANTSTGTEAEAQPVTQSSGEPPQQSGPGTSRAAVPKRIGNHLPEIGRDKK